MTNKLEAAQNSQNDDNMKQQQDIWAQELRRSDERAEKFKNEIDQLMLSKRGLEADNQDLKNRV